MMSNNRRDLSAIIARVELRIERMAIRNCNNDIR